MNDPFWFGHTQPKLMTYLQLALELLTFHTKRREKSFCWHPGDILNTALAALYVHIFTALFSNEVQPNGSLPYLT